MYVVVPFAGCYQIPSCQIVYVNVCSVGVDALLHFVLLANCCHDLPLMIHITPE